MLLGFFFPSPLFLAPNELKAKHDDEISVSRVILLLDYSQVHLSSNPVCYTHTRLVWRECRRLKLFSTTPNLYTKSLKKKCKKFKNRVFCVIIWIIFFFHFVSYIVSFVKAEGNWRLRH